ncbi:MAG: sporulation integral membrane protein YlbJ, partial [Clostridiales bacterium]|nr:sporulation integral membrane protein YlbJ [Clostridiales bacterium]
MVSLFMLFFPGESLAAGRGGLDLWFSNVLPSLLPFLIGTSLLSAAGFVHFLGVLLEPVMMPLFRVPGAGGFAFAAGLLSGYPMGARVTAQLNENGDLTVSESERLLSFVNNAGPLFMIGAVGAGMFMDASAGYFILAVHYTAAIATGLLFRFYKYEKKPPRVPGGSKQLFRKAFRAMRSANLKDSRSFGAKLGESVSGAMETLLMVGGFIILFCVLVEIFRQVNGFGLLSAVIAPLGDRFGVPREIYHGVFTGMLEITNG